MEDRFEADRIARVHQSKSRRLKMSASLALNLISSVASRLKTTLTAPVTGGCLHRTDALLVAQPPL